MSAFPRNLPLNSRFQAFLRERCLRYGGPTAYGRAVGTDPDRIRFWMRPGSQYVSFDSADRLLIGDGMGRRMEEFWPEEFEGVDDEAA